MLSLVVIVPCLLVMSAMLVSYQTESSERWQLVRQSLSVIGKTDELMLQLAVMNASVSEYVLMGGNT